ncbi:concanavalin A-like lectin/glucanase domain-containing protein [Boletus reticuloceps]|uniref:Concanavalin A-like lectin/glucanase domain-containing protein n=1 Tax=Boletus reticuloceps TaxID=495285 RepID=A0A8I2YZN3_9AGAM|nr:concanavalin A-like lectin/glucanase domain-containing protein [Boletus reticuloceps]
MHLSLFPALLLSTFSLFPPLTVARNSIFSHAHKVAIKHSSSLARDLRIALSGMLVAQPGSAPTQNVYCVSNGGSGVIVPSGNGNFSSPSGTSTASGSQSLRYVFGPVFTLETDRYVFGLHFLRWLDLLERRRSNSWKRPIPGNAVMRVETTPTVQNNRMSVRITTDLSFTEGLVILDAVHMPTGCGTWPAFWTDGPDWPNNGEIDIVEGVNNYTNNQATIHTGALSWEGQIALLPSQTMKDAACVPLATTSFGSGFNTVGGGVYASE